MSIELTPDELLKIQKSRRLEKARQEYYEVNEKIRSIIEPLSHFERNIVTGGNIVISFYGGTSTKNHRIYSQKHEHAYHEGPSEENIIAYRKGGISAILDNIAAKVGGLDVISDLLTKRHELESELANSLSD